MLSRNDCFSRLTRAEVEELWIEFRAAIIVARRVKTPEVLAEKARARKAFEAALSVWNGQP